MYSVRPILFIVAFAALSVLNLSCSCGAISNIVSKSSYDTGTLTITAGETISFSSRVINPSTGYPEVNAPIYAITSPSSASTQSGQLIGRTNSFGKIDADFPFTVAMENINISLRLGSASGQIIGSKTVTVVPGPISERSTVEITLPSIIARATSYPNLIRTKLFDRFGNPVNKLPTITSNTGGVVTCSSVTGLNSGVQNAAQCHFTATTAGLHTIELQVEDGVNPNVTISVLAASAASANSTIQTSAPSYYLSNAPAMSSLSNILLVSLKDSFGNPVENSLPTIGSSIGSDVIICPPTDVTGYTQCTLQASTLGPRIFSLNTSGTPLPTTAPALFYGPPSGTNSTLTIDPGSYSTNALHIGKIHIQLRDAAGAVVPNHPMILGIMPTLLGGDSLTCPALSDNLGRADCDIRIGTPGLRTLTLDVINPDPTATMLFHNVTVGVTCPAGYINSLNQAALNLSGTCSENGRNVVIGGAVSSTSACAGNIWSASLNLSTAPQGSVQLTFDHSDASGNFAAQAVCNLQKDSIAPTVTLNQQPAQTDPSPTLPIVYDLVFSEAINPSTLSVLVPGGDIVQGGTSTVTAWQLNNPSSDDRTYVLSSTIATGGTIIPTLPAGSVTDPAGNPNAASTSTDNSVTYTPIGPSSGLTSSITVDAGTYYADNTLYSNVINIILRDASNNALSGVDVSTLITSSLAATISCPSLTNATGQTECHIRSTTQGVHTLTLDVAQGTDPTASIIFQLVTVSIATPAANSYVNISNQNSFAVTGTCSENGRPVAFSGDGVAPDATCTSGAWSANINFSSAPQGNVTLIVNHSSTSGNIATPATRIFIKDTIAPTVTINQQITQADPSSVLPLSFDINFSEQMQSATYQSSNLVIAIISGSANNLGTTLININSRDFIFRITNAVFPTGEATFQVSANAGLMRDLAGNPSISSTSIDNTVTYDANTPSVVLSTLASDPINAPFSVTATFSENVTGLALSDLSLTNATASSLLGSGAVYTFMVTPTGQGLVSIQIPASSAQDSASNNNTASNILTRTFDSIAPTVTINQDASQVDPTGASPILFTVAFSENVSGFSTGDITLSGTAGATTATVSGSGANYSVSVTGMVGTGTVIANIGAGVAQDAAGNLNSASTSSDNQVTYNGVVINSFTILAPMTITYDTTPSVVWGVPSYDPSIRYDIVINSSATCSLASPVFNLSNWLPSTLSLNYYRYELPTLANGTYYACVFANGTPAANQLHSFTVTSPPAPGCGTTFGFNGATGRYTISTPAQLDYVRYCSQNHLIGRSFELTNDIDLQGYVDGNGLPFTPIGNELDPKGGDDTADIGMFHGNGFAIKNLTINQAPTGFKANNVGLFGRFYNTTGNGTIRDLRIENAFINVDAAYNRVGILAGFMSSSSANNVNLLNIAIDGSVGGGTSVGGAIGSTGSFGSSSIFIAGGNFDLDVTVNGDSNIGGLVGYMPYIGDDYINGVVANVSIRGSGCNIGGLIGHVGTSGSFWGIENSTVTGTISNDSNGNHCQRNGRNEGNVGGLVGLSNGTHIYRSSFGGTITAAKAGLGGLVGRSTNNGSGDITESYATGSIVIDASGPWKSLTEIGGLVGTKEGRTVSNSFSTMEITGPLVSTATMVGGLVGLESSLTNGGGTIAQSYASGRVNCSGLTCHAFVGSYDGTYIRGYFDTSSGTVNVSDIVNIATANIIVEGLSSAEMKNQINFVGWNFAAIWNIDPLGIINNGYPFLRFAP